MIKIEIAFPEVGDAVMEPNGRVTKVHTILEGLVDLYGFSCQTTTFRWYDNDEMVWNTNNNRWEVVC